MMNDFTKEELEDIKNCVWVYDDLREDSTHSVLIKKIQSMIDNIDKPCTHKNCRRVRLLDGHEYDICPSCTYINMMR